MILYVAQYVYFDQDHIIGVFSDKQNAKTAIDEFACKNRNHIPVMNFLSIEERCEIVEYELDVCKVKLEHLMDENYNNETD